ncbi:retrovirus-related pol polyprotein from transposon TNT 1-94 [Tanacetum coccineum]
MDVPSRKPIVLDSESPKPVVKLVYSRKPRKNKTAESVSKTKALQPMSANKKEPSKSWGSTNTNIPSTSLNERRLSKLSSVKFGNDQVAKIMGFGDYQIGNVTISRVYYVEGLGHNLFSVGQFCDSNLEVAFRQHTCFIRNLEGVCLVDLLDGIRGINYILFSLLGNMMHLLPFVYCQRHPNQVLVIFRHRRLSHLNFGSINHLARHGLVRGLPKLKFEKDHLCSACALGKSSKKPHKPKSEDTNQEKLYLLHMDLCGPMRVASVSGKKYILVIVDDYSRFTWVKCLRSKDEAPVFIINFLKMIQVRLKETVRRIRTDNGTEFVNQTLREYYEKVGISHETSVARSPQQNGVVERRNRTLIEAARTMLIYAKAPLFLWAEAVATACYTQNRSMIRRRHGKTPYELLHDKPPDLSYLHVFGALCYPTNDSENLGKLQPKADIGIFIGYAPTKKAFRIYNRRTRRIIETIHVDFDELTAMASEHSSSGPALHEMTPVSLSSGLVPNPSPSTPFVPPSRSDWDLLFQPMFDESLNVDLHAPEVIAPIPEAVAPEHASQSAPVGDGYASTDVFKDLCRTRSSNRSVTIDRAADYGTYKWIEDLVPNSMWSQTIVKYDKFALWGISHWGKKRRQFYAFATLRESARDVYSKRRIIAVTKVEIVEWHDYKHLDWITVRRDDDVLYKFKEGDFYRLRIQDIEDMLLLLVQGKVTNLSVEERIAFNVSLRMFTRRVVIQRRVEDLQLGVESYQKKLNLTKPDTYRSNLRRQDAYTPYSDPRGFIYENKDKKNRLMRIDELHKFSDGTLDDVRTALNDRLKGIRMEYLPQTFWSQRDKANARAMIQAIDKRLKTRRIMRSLERFVGGRPYGGDLRLLQRTI